MKLDELNELNEFERKKIIIAIEVIADMDLEEKLWVSIDKRIKRLINKQKSWETICIDEIISEENED